MTKPKSAGRAATEKPATEKPATEKPATEKPSEKSSAEAPAGADPGVADARKPPAAADGVAKGKGTVKDSAVKDGAVKDNAARDGTVKDTSTAKDGSAKEKAGTNGAKEPARSIPFVDEGERKRRQQALEQAVSLIHKKHGTSAIRKLGEQWTEDVHVISTGSLSLDVALGVGGLPRGRVVEIFGPESSGKTTLTLHVVANAQRSGGSAVFIDAEHAFDPHYARKLGVDLQNLIVSQPDYAEQALEICEMLVASQSVDVVVIDSVAALVPKAELEGAMGDQHVGLQARLMSQALRKLTSIVARTNTCVIFINQMREKIGVMFGSPETTPGGKALKFYASVRLDIRRIGSQKQGEQVVGNRTKVKVVKNKLAAPFQTAEFDIAFNKGISWIGDVIDLAVEHNIVKKSGSWYCFGETRLGQGRDNAIQLLEDSKDLRLEVESRLLPILFPPRQAPPKG